MDAYKESLESEKTHIYAYTSVPRHAITDRKHNPGLMTAATQSYTAGRVAHEEERKQKKELANILRILAEGRTHATGGRNKGEFQGEKCQTTRNQAMGRNRGQMLQTSAAVVKKEETRTRAKTGMFKSY